MKNNDIIIFIYLLILLLLSILIKSLKRKKYSSNTKHISESSFQRYALFFNKELSHDDMFEEKLKKIYDLIIKNKESDINNIVLLTNCTYDELILKIKYLKHKGKLNNYYIDENNSNINVCSSEDKKLLKKYYPYIYNKHYSVEEIARRLPNATLDNLKKLEGQILKELDYLDSKGLITGINIDKVDKKIIYYESDKYKNKKESDLISLECENCGASNEVPRQGKVRCEYCETIIEDKSINN